MAGKRIPASETRQIIASVSERHSVPIEDIMGLRRFRPIARARQAAYLALRQRGCAIAVIADVMRRDRKTVEHGIQTAMRGIGA